MMETHMARQNGADHFSDWYSLELITTYDLKTRKYSENQEYRKRSPNAAMAEAARRRAHEATHSRVRPEKKFLSPLEQWSVGTGLAEKSADPTFARDLRQRLRMRLQVGLRMEVTGQPHGADHAVAHYRRGAGPGTKEPHCDQHYC